MLDVSGGEIRSMFMPAYDLATPLYIAAQEGHVKCVEILLQHGEDPDCLVPYEVDETANPSVITPLQIALLNHHVR